MSPKHYKIAAVTPIIKKADLIAELLKNFSSVSKLPFMSKNMRKVAGKQLIHHKEINNMLENMQSGYRSFYATDTIPLQIHHDLIMALCKKQCVFIIMLDLSAAFDMVNHQTLLNRLSQKYGIKGNVHA